MLVAAAVTFVVGFLFMLSGLPAGRSPGPPWPGVPGMMGQGGMMGPGMMGRGGTTSPGLVAPRATPPPAPVASAGTDTSGLLTGLLLLPVGGAALLGWWWLGRPARPGERGQETPLETAKRRYIAGEISLPEFDEMVQALLQGGESLEPVEARARRGRRP